MVPRDHGCIKGACFYLCDQNCPTISGYGLQARERGGGGDDDDGSDTSRPLGGSPKSSPGYVQSTPMDLSMSSRRFVKINPFNTGINPVTFQVDPQEDFVDLSESYFEVELTVKKDINNTNLLTADLIGLANNLAHTLFKQINIRLDGTLISPQTDTYHYKAFIEALLNHDHDDGKTLLTPEGWYNSLDVPDDNDADEYTANMLDTTHADYAALSDKKRLWWIVEYNSWV